MKYLKNYKLFEFQISRFDESDVNDVFEAYINWKLIEDAKDMALEYIDDGMSLGVEISYINHYVYHIRYNHKETYSEWISDSFNNLTEGPYELEPIDRNKIIYQFYLEKDDGMIDKESDKELELRVKEAYPDENINPRYSFSDMVDESIKSENVRKEALRNYNLFESVSDIMSDIKDIFQSDIKEDIDSGYDMDIFDVSGVIIIELSKWSNIIQNEPPYRNLNKRTPFEIEEIEDGIHRILNYMTDKNYDNYITTKLRAMDDWTVLTMKEGDYTKFKLGSQEWRFNNIVSRVKISFTKQSIT